MGKELCDECEKMVMPILKDGEWYACPLCNSKLGEL